MKEKKILIEDLEKVIKPLPEVDSIYKWLYDYPFGNGHYAYFRKIFSGVYTVYCSCGETFALSKVRGVERAVCPKCKKTVKLRNIAYKTELTDKGYIAFLQNTKLGLLHRICEVVQTTDIIESKVTVKYSIEEKQRDLLRTPTLVQKWHTRYAYEQSRGNVLKWINGRKADYFGYYSCPIEEQPIYLYTNGIKEILGKFPEYKYSQLNVAGRHFTLNAIDYLQAYVSHPQLEFLIKLKLYALANDFLKCVTNWRSYVTYFSGKEKTLFDFVGTKDKKMIKYIRNQNLNHLEIKALWEIAQAKYPITKGLINFYVEFNQCGVHSGLDRRTISKYAMYLLWKRNLKHYPKERDFLSDYNDYVRWAFELGYDMQDTKNSKPKDFKYAHDVTHHRFVEMEDELTARRIKAEKQRQAREEKKRQYVISALKDKYNQILSFERYGFTVVVPSTPAEIIDEGERQGHCVGTYVGRVAEGRSVIAFIRQTSDILTPYYTVELDPIHNFELVQCRGKKNASTTEKVEKFLSAWEKHYCQKLKEVEGATK